MPKQSVKQNTNRVPKLRFPGFKGEWEEKKLGEVGTFFRGGGISKEEISEFGKYQCIRYGELYTEYGEIIKVVKSRTNISPELSLFSVENDLLIPSSGETAIDIATVSSLRHKEGVLIGGDVNVIRLVENHTSEFFSYYLSNFKNKEIARLSQGYSVVHLYSSHLKTLKINLPSNSEQKKIADFLESIDDLIKNLQIQKSNLESYKKGIMQKIFSQGIRFKDEGGKEFPEWEEKRLGTTGEIVGGGTPDTTDNRFWNGDINWFTPTEIKQKYTENSLRRISKSGLKYSSAKLLPIGTLLFTSRATVGDISISKVECSTNQGFQSIIANNSNSNEFLYYWIVKNKNEFLKRANGSTFLEISSKEMRKMKISLPTLLEQQKIASFLTSLDKVIESKERHITQAEKWKKGLIHQLFI